MGNSVSDTLDPNVSFKEYMRWGVAPYPQSPQFQARVSEAEWTDLCSDLYFTQRVYYIVFLLLIAAAFSTFISAIATSSIVFALLIVIVLASSCWSWIMLNRLANVAHAYNNALFKHRGIQLAFFAGAKHNPSCLHGKMAYPATYEMAQQLYVSNTSLYRRRQGSVSVCEGEWGNPQTRDQKLEARYAAANEAFARSPLARASGPSTGNGQAYGGIAMDHHYGAAPSSTIPYGGYPATAAHAVPAGQVSVQVPMNALPGSIVQVVHNGVVQNILVPPGVQPGQMLVVNTPPAQQYVGPPVFSQHNQYQQVPFAVAQPIP